MGICVSRRRRERKAPEKYRVPGAGGPKGAAAESLPRRGFFSAMAKTISNIKMSNPIKGMVSGHRKRYKKDGFNLDLAYITDRLIAMGFPAEKLEGVYRNHIDEVYRFLEHKHKDRYFIYNLCTERSYDTAKFHKRVARFAFEDHAPPKMEQIQPFCESVHNWLNENTSNVAVVHCKAGKGRTGTMVCCYLLYSGQKTTADEALQFYGTKRTHDEKGVTIPSQRRYVEYYAALVRGGLRYSATRVHIRELLLTAAPMLNGGQCALEVTVTQAAPTLKWTLGSVEARREDGTVRVCATACTPLAGDVRVDVFCKSTMMKRRERLFHFWFNTYFVSAGVGAQPVPAPTDSPNLETFKLTLNKWQLDDAHKDKQHKIFTPDFKVELIVQKQPASSTFGGRAAGSPSPASSGTESCSEPDTEPDAHWDSGEYLAPLYYRLGASQTPSDLTPPEKKEYLELPPEEYPYRPGQYPTSDTAGEYPTYQQREYPAKDVKKDNYLELPAGVYSYPARDVTECKNKDGYLELPAGQYLYQPGEYPGRDVKECKKNNKDSYSKPRLSPARDFTSDQMKECKKSSKDSYTMPRLSLGDMRASWREFSGKFGENRKKKSRDD